jgi:glyoxylase-like metal-dependent hydrolase (beta-lactamase superfamily II)
MRIHHLNCGTMCPVGRRLINAEGRTRDRGRLVCHCLLIETDRHGLVLVDTGLGRADVTQPKERLGRAFTSFVSPVLDPREPAVAQLAALGLRAEDVRHLVVTHLDLDHAGGLADFPHARVHVMRPERDAALHPGTRMERERYRPSHWAHGPEWSVYDTAGERWFGFECVRELAGLPPDLLLVPLVGHSRGHAGIAVDTGGGRWMLHCGDAYFFHGELDFTRPTCPPLLRAFQTIVQVDGKMRLHNQQRLRELVHTHGAQVRVFCAHDPTELDALRGA